MVPASVQLFRIIPRTSWKYLVHYCFNFNLFTFDPNEEKTYGAKSTFPFKVIPFLDDTIAIAFQMFPTFCQLEEESIMTLELIGHV